MKRAMHNPRTLLFVALVALLACGDLLADPSFDLWCGDTLCKPWEVTGKVERVKTWHKNDYGVSLGKAAVLSQLSTHDPVGCIAFEVIADVSASADVWLEMDFRDDGSSEYKQLVPESHFAKLRYLVKAPTWYDKLRFILRKKGSGRAVLAQIRATNSDECQGDALPLPDRPAGAGCKRDDECAINTCDHAPEPNGPGLAFDFGGQSAFTCGECSDATPCSDGKICAAAEGDVGPYRACVETASQDTGTWCLTPNECQSALCSAVVTTTHATCAECASDEDCKTGEVCGVDSLDKLGVRAARVCTTPTTRKLGELCAADAECKSGACNQGACSECNDKRACKGGAKCGIAAEEWLTAEASLCDPGAAKRKPGQACTSDGDCVFGTCDEPDAICQLCVGDGCEGMRTDDCGFLRRLAGTCR